MGVAISFVEAEKIFASECNPLLLLVLELNGGNVWLLHSFGVALILGRVYHIKGMLANDLRSRVRGMKITLYSLIALSLVNLLYLPFEKMF